MRTESCKSSDFPASLRPSARFLINEAYAFFTSIEGRTMHMTPLRPTYRYQFPLSDHIVYALDEDNSVIAVCILCGFHAENNDRVVLNYLYVSPAHRRKHIAGLLVNEAIRLCVESDRILVIEVLAENEEANAFWRRRAKRRIYSSYVLTETMMPS